MTKDEALRLALEALKTIDEAMPFPVAKLAIKECTAALEANEFNPDWDTQAVLTEEIQRMAKRIEELEAKGEPVVRWDSDGWGDLLVDSLPDGTLLYTTPPQRTWVGLTDEDIEQEFGFIDELLRDCVQRTEAKLKEKNT